MKISVTYGVPNSIKLSRNYWKRVSLAKRNSVMLLVQLQITGIDKWKALLVLRFAELIDAGTGETWQIGFVGAEDRKFIQ